jgi:apolipoprotein N-acyltransferase
MKSIFKQQAYINAILLALLSGLLLYFAWPNRGVSVLLFVALVPILYVFKLIKHFRAIKRIIIVFLSFFFMHLVWLIGGSSWLVDSFIKSYISDSVIESLTFAFPFILLAVFKYNKQWQFWFLFISIWMSIDYLNQNWLLGTPYYILGSGFGMSHNWIQTYEFIGIEGGSMAILLSNISLFLLANNYQHKKKIVCHISTFVLSISPFLISYLLMSTTPDNTKGKQAQVAILHTYTPTYTAENHYQPDKMIHHLWNLSKDMDTSSTLLIWPETIISNLGWLSNQANEIAYQTFQTILKDKPELTICTGGFAFTIDPKGKKNPYASHDAKRNFYYNTHNVAISYYSNGAQSIRSKQIFVPFQERIPYLEKTNFMTYFADVVGANSKTTFFTKGKNIHFTSKNETFTPILCFESIYPLNMAQQSKNVDFIAVLANEHWNPNFNGSKQYLYNSVAMAIQSRIPIFRSSNNGISAIIDKYGNIVQTKAGKEEGIINARAEIKTSKTFYEGINGLLYKIGLIFLFILSLYGLLLKIKNHS